VLYRERAARRGAAELDGFFEEHSASRLLGPFANSMNIGSRATLASVGVSPTN
jgi:hypothetical protein